MRPRRRRELAGDIYPAQPSAAAGGADLRIAEQALAMIEAGASRIGTSASVRIAESFKAPAGLP